MLSFTLTVLIPLILLSGCTGNISNNKIVPTPTRIPGTEKLDQLKFQHFSQKNFGLEFDYPQNWTIKTATTDQIRIENQDSSATINIIKKVTKLDISQFGTNQLLTVANDFPAYLKSNDKFSQTSIYIPMGKIHYLVSLDNAQSKQEINLIFGKISISLDPSSNPSAFICPKNNGFDPSSQPDEYLPWANINCPKL